MSIEAIKNEVGRQLNNLSSVPLWNSTMSKAEVEFLFSEYSGTVFCNGVLRQIHVDPITNNLFKVYTRRFA